MSDRKQALLECIDYYASSIGTEHEKRERKVLDQAIDAALGVTSDDKLREAAEGMVVLADMDRIPAPNACVWFNAFDRRIAALRAALADSATGDTPGEIDLMKALVKSLKEREVTEEMGDTVLNFFVDGVGWPQLLSTTDDDVRAFVNELYRRCCAAQPDTEKCPTCDGTRRVGGICDRGHRAAQKEG